MGQLRFNRDAISAASSLQFAAPAAKNQCSGWYFTQAIACNVQLEALAHRPVQVNAHRASDLGPHGIALIHPITTVKNACRRNSGAVHLASELLTCAQCEFANA